MSNPVSFFWPSVENSTDYVAFEQEVAEGQDVVLNVTPAETPVVNPTSGVVFPGMGRQVLVTLSAAATLDTVFSIEGMDIFGNTISDSNFIIPATDTEAYTSNFYHRVTRITLITDGTLFTTPIGLKVGLGPSGFLGMLNTDYNRTYWNLTVQGTLFLNPVPANESRYTVFGSPYKLGDWVNNVWTPSSVARFYNPDDMDQIYGSLPTMTKVNETIQAQIPNTCSTVGAFIDFGTGGYTDNFRMSLAILQQGI
jgi:hypothetical protein